MYPTLHDAQCTVFVIARAQRDGKRVISIISCFDPCGCHVDNRADALDVLDRPERVPHHMPAPKRLCAFSSPTLKTSQQHL